VDVAHLIGIHEARIAHHVAAVGEVDREDRAATVLDGARPVIVNLVLGHRHVATAEEALDPGEELRVDGDHVLEAAVRGARLLHDDLAVLLDDARADLPGFVVDQRRPVGVAAEDLGAGLLDAIGAEAVGLARPAEGRRRALLAAGDGRVTPLRVEGLGERAHPVDPLHQRPDLVGGERNNLFEATHDVHRQTFRCDK
jgi:hypothetical protein